ncbi:MAG: hypothetical protein BGO40_12345 [Chryseobacterium sp. 39-10]|uniref:Uncharacterized protein n=1 Tax=Chryseobacterium taklimakanense TaxID=536441 RepID=A0A239XTV4_9FLAO|nr:hypothetical protein [Chryseobacterium taklimakanense]MDV4117644.1 hypothetical protein [Elizabethkingia anophelis]OJV47021.1 MAG: hypothetical protein BGO40_12345 [Chryseobacterium sp. 39-10]SNV49782.1 Uncharacterised protein [Chryseobacterium taklimakanense]
MIRKEIITGFLVGIIANIVGTLGYLLLFSDLSIASSLQIAQKQGHIGSILALGALLNLVAFFGFIKLKRDHRAKGVLIATFLTAIIILLLKLF